MGDTPRRWFRLRLRTMMVLVLLATIGLSIYSYWSDYSEQSTRRQRELLSPETGAACTVVLHRELLGLSRMAASPGTIEGISNSVRGRFVLMNDEWIVLAGPTSADPQQWIPRENVLLLEVISP